MNTFKSLLHAFVFPGIPLNQQCQPNLKSSSAAVQMNVLCLTEQTHGTSHTAVAIYLKAKLQEKATVLVIC